MYRVSKVRDATLQGSQSTGQAGWSRHALQTVQKHTHTLAQHCDSAQHSNAFLHTYNSDRTLPNVQPLASGEQARHDSSNQALKGLVNCVAMAPDQRTTDQRVLLR
jgi:hypothetical protein